jgi:hypothetical protein
MQLQRFSELAHQLQQPFVLPQTRNAEFSRVSEVVEL